MSDQEQLCINAIRMLSIDAVQQANSGHPGMPMGAATMAYVLWTRHLRHNPRNPGWPDRDRFVLSAGHASMLLYSLLFLTGYDLGMEDLEHSASGRVERPVILNAGPRLASRSPRARLGRASATASAWRSRSGGSRRPSIGMATMSWTTRPTSSPAMAT